VFIPRFCDHPLLEPVGVCRQCMVEVSDGTDTKPLQLQPSCTLQVAEGMRVATQITSQRVAAAQAAVLELLLVNHPLDCPECDKGGECPLQNQAMQLSRGQQSRFAGVKRTFEKPISVTPTILLDRERCILCERCTRFAAEISGDTLFAFSGRGARTHLIANPAAGGGYFTGNTVQLCPVGALTSTDYRFHARTFELVSTESTCDGCAAGCQIRNDVKNGTLLRRLAGNDSTHNAGWLCDRGRYGFHSAQGADRLRTPLLRQNGELVAVSWPTALDAAAKGLRGLAGSQVAVIPGGRLTLENAYAYSRFARMVLQTNNIDYRTRASSDEEARFLMRKVTAQPVGYGDLEQARKVVLLCFEPEEESPMVFLRLRRAVRHHGLQVVAVAPFLSAGNRKLAAQLLACSPGNEAQMLAMLSGMIGKDTVVLVGERAASAAGTYKWLADTVAATGAKVAWLPRRPGELAALAAGCLPSLLPGGRLVADTAARTNLLTAWDATSLPTQPGYSLNDIAVAAATGEMRAIITGALDPRDLPNSELVNSALDATFVVSLEVRRSAVTEYADVVFPVAAIEEQSGNFIDWTYARRPVVAAVQRNDVMPDVRVLAALAEALGADLGFQTTAAALESYDSLGYWRYDPATLPAIEVVPTISQVPGNVIFATWRQLLDDARLLDGAAALRATAAPLTAKMSPVTAATHGFSDGAIAQLGAGGARWRGVVQIVPDMVDGVVWVPALSEVTTHGHLSALPGERVILAEGDMR
jgi:NADH-quinone oxidoreductase subunit G